MILTSAMARYALLARTRTVAMVGASATTTRPSYFVFSYLRTKGRLAIAPLRHVDSARALAR